MRDRDGIRVRDRDGIRVRDRDGIRITDGIRDKGEGQGWDIGQGQEKD